MPTGASIADRTRQVADPVRNFKFQVQMFLSDANSNSALSQEIGRLGFMVVEGIAMNTDMVQYREGGWNTNPHKLPGQTDFAPLTMSSGVFQTKPGMWNLAKQMFNIQWGGLNKGIARGQEFRYDLAVRVMDHPVTSNPGSGSPGDGFTGAVMAFVFYNCWTASIGFNNLTAMENAIMVHQMQVHHEGFDVFFDNEAIGLEHA